jgi:hypothetical protein
MNWYRNVSKEMRIEGGKMAVFAHFASFVMFVFDGMRNSLVESALSLRFFFTRAHSVRRMMLRVMNF